MTNAEKFKEVFGFTECTQTLCRDCQFTNVVSKEGGCGVHDFWQSEYKEPSDKMEEIFKKCHGEQERLLKEINEITINTKWQKAIESIKEEIKALSPTPTAYDVVDGNPIKDAIWEILIEVEKIIDKHTKELM